MGNDSKLSANKRSGKRLQSASQLIRQRENAVWRIARKAPMFMKASQIEVDNPKGGKSLKTVYKRSQRLINSHAYLVNVSGAASNAASVIRNSAAVFRESVEDEGRSPWLPQISPGACAALEQFLCAYAATATHNAMKIRKELNTSKQLGEKLMNMGYDVANETIFSPTCLAPRIIAAATELKIVRGTRTAHPKMDKTPAHSDTRAHPLQTLPICVLCHIC